MKIRSGFVSNSSTSSFICEVSGDVSVYYDGSDFGCECENGHTFEDKYILKKKPYSPSEINNETKLAFEDIIKLNDEIGFIGVKKKYHYIDENVLNNVILIAKKSGNDEAIKLLLPIVNDYLQKDNDNNGYLPSHRCPICQFVSLRRDDVVRYLLKHYGKEYKEVEKDIKDKFSSYDDFLNFL